MALQDDLLHVVDGKVVPSAFAMTMQEFKDLSIEELSYVYFMGDHRSPFATYDWNARMDEVKISIFGEDSTWEPSAKVLTAGKRYEELLENSSIRLLKAARESVHKLEAYFRSVDLMMLDDRGKPIFKAGELVGTLEKMGKVVDGLTRLEDIVKKEEQANNPNRGGVEVNKYSM